MKVVIIGTGNVATVLGRKIKRAGYDIIQVYGRRSEEAEKLAEELSSGFCSTWESLDRTADLYIIAISDKALYDLPFNLADKLVVHTAGSVSKEVLKNISANYGVLYPLQSLRKELNALTVIPLLVDANNEAGRKILLEFAGNISEQTGEADDTERMKLHVAAVITSNFTNHLYTLGEEYCRKEGLDFSLLYPLINETAERIRFISPSKVQTGPAIRKDDVTINNHISLLAAHPSIRDLYIQLTRSIRENR